MNALIEAKLEELLAAIDSSTDAWIKEWISVGQPKNFTTGKNYRGVNVFLLWAAQGSWPTASWATYKQWANAGYQVRKGEKSTAIFITKEVERLNPKEGQDDKYRLMRCADRKSVV